MQWSKIIQACQASELTNAAWCEQNHINLKTYYYWLRRIRMLSCGAEEPAGQVEQSIVALPFKPTSYSNSSAAIMIRMPTITIEIHNGASKDSIEAVLAAMKTTC